MRPTHRGGGLAFSLHSRSNLKKPARFARTSRTSSAVGRPSAFRMSRLGKSGCCCGSGGVLIGRCVDRAVHGTHIKAPAERPTSSSARAATRSGCSIDLDCRASINPLTKFHRRRKKSWDWRGAITAAQVANGLKTKVCERLRQAKLFFRPGQKSL